MDETVDRPSAAVDIKGRLISLDVQVEPEPSKPPTTLAELLIQPKEGPFLFFQQVRQTQPGESFFIEKLRKNPKTLFWWQTGDPTELIRDAERHRQIVAMVIVKDRAKGVLKPTASDLTILRELNEGTGRTPRNVVLVNVAIQPKTDDLELLLMAEVRGRMKALSDKEITPRDIGEAASIVEFQADPIVAVQKLRERFQNVWEFAFVAGARLNPAKARDQVRRFQNLTA